jgi:hypothetical protein
MREIDALISRHEAMPHAALTEIAAANNSTLATWVNTRREHFINKGSR